MHEKIFVDTNFIIELIAGNDKVRTFFENNENLFINAIVFSKTVFILIKLRTGLSTNTIKKKSHVKSSSCKDY